MAATATTATFDAQARTSDRRNGPCRVSAPQRTASEDGQGRGRSTRRSTRRSSGSTPPPRARHNDSVPEFGGSRPDRLHEVRPQERVLRHTVEQSGDVAPGLPALNALVPQMVDQLEDVLQIVDLFVPAQEIEVPKISSLPRPPPRRVLPVPQTAEQLVDVPLPEWMRLALGSDAFGRVWTCVWMPSTGVCGILEGTRHTQRTRPTGFTASPGRCINTGQG